LGFISCSVERPERLDWRGFCEAGSGFWEKYGLGLDMRFLGRKQQKKKQQQKQRQ
jgi:hypothetical protein